MSKVANPFDKHFKALAKAHRSAAKESRKIDDMIEENPDQFVEYLDEVEKIEGYDIVNAFELTHSEDIGYSSESSDEDEVEWDDIEKSKTAFGKYLYLRHLAGHALSLSVECVALIPRFYHLGERSPDVIKKRFRIK